MNTRHVLATSALLAGLGAVSAALGVDPTAIASVTESPIRELYANLIEAENAHDIEKVRAMVWDSPDALFVAKTKTAAEGNWAGFWGKEGSSSSTSTNSSRGPFGLILTTQKRRSPSSPRQWPRLTFRWTFQWHTRASLERQSRFS